MERQPQNPEFRNNPENFHTCMYFYPLYNHRTGNPYTGTLENSEDPDEMQHKAEALFSKIKTTLRVRNTS